MKRLVLGIATVGALLAVITLSRSTSLAQINGIGDPNALNIEAGEKNPWTSQRLNNDVDQFQFAVVSDRTGGHRAKVCYLPT